MGKTTKIKQVGIGEGAGEYVEVLQKRKIEKRVEELEDREDYDSLLRSAWLKHNYSDCDGVIAIDLISGEFFTYARYSYIANHEIDNNYIDVVVIYKDFKYNIQNLLEEGIDCNFYIDLEERYSEEEEYKTKIKKNIKKDKKT
ncbi:MAG: hypothetical protein LR001_06315 [Clostridiales bacterium]|nr:hypothetical protein [Clostridiales bacterium]